MEEEVVIEDLASDSELSYLDYGEDFVILFFNNNFVCPIKVFTDRENEKREYICVNNEITYLDTITKK